MKEQVKVLINSKKDLKIKRSILNEIGETADKDNECGWFMTCECIYYDSVKKLWISASNSCFRFYELKEISIRDLIILLTKPEEEKVFVMTSEDGVELYRGDNYFMAKKIPATGNIWKLCIENAKMNEISFAITDSEVCKAFSTKESAEKWIEKANHPKYKSVQLYHGMEARIYHHNSEVAIMDGGHHIHTMTFGDIHDIRSIINQD